MAESCGRKVLIMCQGQGWRWKDDLPKQLALINDEPIICRTLRQLRALGQDDITVVGWPVFEEYVDCSVYTQPGDDCGPLVRGLRNTWQFWSDDQRTVILLGDVIFSWHALETIFSDDAPIRFYGRAEQNRVTGSSNSELFGVSFLYSGADSLRAQIQYLVDDLGCVGHLWSLYRTVVGIHHSLHETEDVVLQQIDDYTDDLDHVWEYNQYSAILGAQVSEDDSCHGNLQD